MEKSTDVTEQDQSPAPAQDVIPEQKAAPEPRKMKGLPPINYDQSAIYDFVKTVFHADLADSEICTYATSGKPGYPDTAATTIKRLNGPAPAMACYYSTATMHRSEDGRLYNRQSAMQAMHVVVLDDIGTKIPKSKIPKNLDPTYKIETSEGNEQWGLVLEEPITNVEEAKLLISLVYSSGFTDEGGAMANKIVRLPCGINGKTDPMTGEKSQFPVTLLDAGGPYYTPQGILDDLGLRVNWEEAKSNPAVRRYAERSRGTMAGSDWSGYATLAGAVDPVVMWLYERQQVVQDAGDWLTLKCPWAHEHTSGDGTAGYSPLGVGNEEHLRSSRGFHCFHEHCANRKATDFLQYVVMCGGPQAAAYDPGYALVAQYTLVAGSHAPYLLNHGDGDGKPEPMHKEAFVSTYPDKVNVELGHGKQIKFNSFEMLIRHPLRAAVAGVRSVPNNTLEQTVIVEGGHVFANTFRLPPHAYQPPVKALPERADIFFEHLRYLVPNDIEHEYVLDWLATKVQDITYRGPLILMLSDGTEGLGRTTLGKCLIKLFGEENTASLDATKELNAKFKPWLEKSMVIYNELDFGATGNFEKDYDNFKKYHDTTPQHAPMELKGIDERQVLMTNSAIGFTNNLAAMKTSDFQRRVMMVGNPTDVDTTSDRGKALHQYVIDRCKFLSENDSWVPHVWAKLKARKVTQNMTGTPPHTETRDIAKQASSTYPERMAAAILEEFPGALVPNKGALRAFVTHIVGMASQPGEHIGKRIDACMLAVEKALNTHEFHRKATGKMTVRVAGKSTTVRYRLRAEHSKDMLETCNVDAFAKDAFRKTMAEILRNDPDMVTRVTAASNREED